MTALRKFVPLTLLGTLAVIPQTMSAQQSVSAQEGAAADVVAELVGRVREQGGFPKLRRIKDRYLRHDACRRAERGDESVAKSTGIGPPEKVGMLSVLSYSTVDPSQAPTELLEWAKGTARQYGQPHRFAVGVCLVSSAKDSEQKYWIDVGTYMSALKSTFNVPTWD